MKLYELIIELEKLEQQGKRNYEVWITDGEVEKPLVNQNQITYSDQYLEIMLG